MLFADNPPIPSVLVDPAVMQLIQLATYALIGLLGAITLWITAKAKAIGQSNATKLDTAAGAAVRAEKAAVVANDKIDVNNSMTAASLLQGRNELVEGKAAEAAAAIADRAKNILQKNGAAPC